MLIRFYLLFIVIVTVSNLLNFNTGTPVSTNGRKTTIEWSHLISKRATDRENAGADLRRMHQYDEDDDNEAEDADDAIDWHLLSPSHADDLNDALRYRRKRAISSYTNLASSQKIGRHSSANKNRRQKIRQPIFRPFSVQQAQEAQQQHLKFINKKHWRSKRGLIVNDDNYGQDLNSDTTFDKYDDDDDDLQELSDEELKQLAQFIYEMQLLNDKGSTKDDRGYSYSDEMDRPTVPFHHRRTSGGGGGGKRRMKKRSLEPTYYGYRTSPDRALPRDVVWLRPAANLDGDDSGGESPPPVGQIGTIVGPYSYEPAFYGASTLLDATEAASRRRLGETELEKRIVSLARYLNNNRARRRRR